MKILMAVLTLLVATQGLAQEKLPFIVLEPVSAEAQAKVKQAFVEINGKAWDNELLHIGETTGLILSARRSGQSTAAVTGEQAVEFAREFVVENRELLGIDYWDAEKYLDYRFTPSIAGNVVVRSQQKKPYEGYYEVRDFGYDIEVILRVTGDGVQAVLNRSTRLTGIDGLETEPQVPFYDQAILGKMIGREMTYSGFSGEETSAGIIAALNIRPIGLTIDDHRTDKGALWVGLVWKYEVVLGGLTWHFHFSAVDGELVFIQQNFAT